jgi:hypothetical protein
MTQHTPGPWTDQSIDGSQWGVYALDGTCVAQAQQVASRRADRYQATRTANARLISKAPEMRDLIFELFEDPDVWLILGGNPNRIHALTDRAVALIDYLKRETQ